MRQRKPNASELGEARSQAVNHALRDIQVRFGIAVGRDITVKKRPNSRGSRGQKCQEQNPVFRTINSGKAREYPEI